MKKLFIKICRTIAPAFLITVFLILTLASCATSDRTNIESYIGLYEVVDSKCDAEEGTVNPCEDTHYFELVKGQFMGVNDSELAYVFWSGDPKIDPELQYSSFLIEHDSSGSLRDGKFWLSDDIESQEYLGFSEGKLTTYYAKYVVGNNGKVRIVEYSLKPVARNSLSHVNLNYPGNK